MQVNFRRSLGANSRYEGAEPIVVPHPFLKNMYHSREGISGYMKDKHMAWTKPCAGQESRLR